ncbi:MAG: hypothetical protein AAF146_02115 [Bacteroidota bacterium]
MPNDLQLLLTEVVGRQRELERALESCVADRDFTGAASYHTALLRTQRELRRLKALADPRYDQRQELRSLIQKYTQIVEAPSTGEAPDPRQQKRLAVYRRQLARLEEQHPTAQQDGDLLLIHLEELVSGLGKWFRLEVPSVGWAGQIERLGAGLHICLYKLDRAPLAQQLTSAGRVVLARCGFRLGEYEAVYERPVFQKEQIAQVHEILAVVFIEALNCYDRQEMRLIFEY